VSGIHAPQRVALLAGQAPEARIIAGPAGAEPLRFGKSSYVRAQAGGVAELYLYDEIGGGSGLFSSGVSANDVVRALEACRGCSELRVRVSSPGGDFFEGLAIYNAIARFEAAKKVCSVDGLAASIASVIALACDHRVTAANAQWMVHNARTPHAAGESGDMRKLAERLDQASALMAETYAKRTGKPLDEVKAWMAEERWFTAAEAKDSGLSHETEGDADVAVVALHASALDRFEKTPQTLRLAAHAAVPHPAPITPAPSADPKEPHMLKLIAARLGLPETASEADIIAALARVQDDGARARTEAKAAADALAPVLALTGKATSAEALGAIQGFKAEAEKVPGLVAKLDAIEKAQLQAKRDALIDQGKREGKLPPALEAWAKDQPIASLEAFLAAAAPVVTPVVDAKKPGQEPTPAAVTDEQKSIAAKLGVKPEDVAKVAASAQ
jgi:ATP-dependent protease ClpP protease subunit